MQLAQFIFASDRHVVAQVAVGDELGVTQGFHQRADDQTSDHPGSQNAEQQRGDGCASQKHIRVIHVVGAHNDLVGSHFLAGFQQAGHVIRQGNLCLLGLGHAFAELPDRSPKGDQRLINALNGLR